MSAPGRLPWRAREDDPGVAAVDAIGRALSLDAEWSVQDERGFTWWGKDLAQSVWSDPGYDDGGIEIFRLHARTDLLRDFAATDENLAGLNVVAAGATTSGYLVDEDVGTVQLAASMYLHADTASWVQKAFQLVVGMQAADAQIKSSPLAELTGSSPAASAHPRSGRRGELDEMLHLLEHVVVPLGDEPSFWAGEGMAEAVRFFRSAPFTVHCTGGERGLSLELPLQSRTSLVTVRTEERHPQVGSGALFALHLPMAVGEPEATRLAFRLSRRELERPTRAHLVGGWCSRAGSVHHVSFAPNAMRLGGSDVLNLTMAMGSRARWVAETVYGDDWEANLDDAGPLATPALEDLVRILDEDGE